MSNKQDQAQAQPQTIQQEAPPQAVDQKLIEQLMADYMAKDHSRREQQIRERVGMGEHGLWASDMNGLYELAKMVVRSGLAPVIKEQGQKQQMNAEACFIAMAKGAELGLSHMQALWAIAVINGRPTLWGDDMLGLCMASGKLEDYQTQWVGEQYNDDYGIIVRVKRKDFPSWFVEKWTVADSKLANLWKKAGPWTNFPRRMMEMRSRGFALRNAFPDILRGILTAEEAMDIPPDDGPGGSPLPDIQPGADPLSEAVATYGQGNGKAQPSEPEASVDPEPANEPEPEQDEQALAQANSATISRSDLQRLRSLSPKVFNCSREQIAEQIQKTGWGWNGGEPLGYAIESLEAIPALDGMRMVEELEVMARELASAEGGA